MLPLLPLPAALLLRLLGLRAASWRHASRLLTRQVHQCLTRALRRCRRAKSEERERASGPPARLLRLAAQ